jgi:hypothetical protein
MIVIHATQHITIPMTDVFGTFLPNIYLFFKTRFGNLKSNFQEFQELMNKYAKELCICNSNLMVFNIQQFRKKNINRFFSFFSAGPFANYFVLSIKCKYGISPNNGNLKRTKGSEVLCHVIEPIS